MGLTFWRTDREAFARALHYIQSRGKNDEINGKLIQKSDIINTLSIVFPVWGKYVVNVSTYHAQRHSRNYNKTDHQRRYCATLDTFDNFSNKKMLPEFDMFDNVVGLNGNEILLTGKSSADFFWNIQFVQDLGYNHTPALCAFHNFSAARRFVFYRIVLQAKVSMTDYARIKCRTAGVVCINFKFRRVSK